MKRLSIEKLPLEEHNIVRIGPYLYKVLFRIGSYHLLWRI